MQSRTSLTGFPRRQASSGQKKRPRKGQKLGQNQFKVAKEQQRTPPAKAMVTRSQVNPTQVSASAAKKRPPVVVPAAVKPIPTAPGKIPPFKPSNFQQNKPSKPNKPKNVKYKTVRVRKQALPKKVRSYRKTRLKPMARTMLYALRLLIVGVGIGAIVGTALSILDPATRVTTTGTSSGTNLGQTQTQPTPTPATPPSGLSLSQEISALKSTLQNLIAANPNFTPGVFVADLENGTYVDINASSSFPAASTIKIPILFAFFQDVDAGKIRLDETLTMQKDMVASGSGDMQYKPAGTQFTALEVATKMMTVSDNTATNMLIARMGGIEALNQRFRSWGLTNTAIRNQLPDLEGTNTSTPKELGNLMAMVSRGNLVSMSSRDRILDIMRSTARNHLLPKGLGEGATIAHKTGDIGKMLADAGLVDLPTNKRYVVAVMVQRPNNDSRAEKLITSISRAAYQQFTQTNPNPSNNAPNTSNNAPNTNNNPPNPTPPTTSYQSPVVTPPAPTNTIPPIGSTFPTTGYQSPPLMSPPYPNNMGSTYPTTGYQSPPLMSPPQYYYPYQR